MTETANKKEWYVVNTYAGHENRVKDNLEKAVENNGMQNLIQEVVVPTEEVVEIRNGKRVTTQHKTFPGYVLVRMIITNESWYVVRNTRGVTGFVGSGNKPTPLSETDFASIFDTVPQARIDIQVGDEVRILTGLFENFTGKVTAIDAATQQLTVTVPMLKRETDVQLAYDEVVREG